MTLLEMSQLLGNVGEFFGALLLLASLFYVAVQVRQNTQAMRVSGQQALITNFYGNQQLLARDSELNDLLRRGVADCGSLSDVEKSRFGWLVVPYEGNLYNGLLLHRAGLLESGDAEAAQLAASDAIERCRRSLRQNYLVLARCIHARARLRISGSDAFDEVHATFDEVEDSIAELGASTLSPRLLEWRAELAGARGDDRERERLLRAAQQGYTEIDAPRRAEAIYASIASA